MVANRLNVAIAGGGIGGLATALALARRGIESRVYERRQEFPEEGAGIQIGPNGTRILRDLGVADLLHSGVAVPDCLSVRDGATARELTRLPLGTWIAERHGSPYWTAHRKDLHTALRTRAETEPLITLKTGVEIVSFINESDNVHAVGSKGEVLSASVLIAADGLWSGLRQYVTAGSAPKPVGKSAFRSVVSAERLSPELTPNAVHIWLAPGAHAIHYPVNGGHDIALVVIADDASRDTGWDAPAPADAVHEKIRDFAPPLRTLIAGARDWRHWSLCSMPPLAHWTAGRVALLGDAAHPVLPFLAQGAVLALEDAVTLAAHLSATEGGVEASLRDYERSRRQRVLRVAEASQRNGRIYHMRGATALARNTAMRIRPPTGVMAGFDWMYGWRLAPC
jgi:salicylate hydroxylase